MRFLILWQNQKVLFWLSIEGLNKLSLKVVFFAYFDKSLLVVYLIQLRKASPKLPKKYDFEVPCILTTINLVKSRQTNEIIPNRIMSEFNTDFANLLLLKLNDFDSSMDKSVCLENRAKTKNVEITFVFVVGRKRFCVKVKAFNATLINMFLRKFALKTIEFLDK